MTIGQRIRAWRKSAALSERELAEAIGVTPPAIYQWERHGKTPSLGNLQKIAKTVGVTMEEFYGPTPRASKASAS